MGGHDPVGHFRVLGYLVSEPKDALVVLEGPAFAVCNQRPGSNTNTGLVSSGAGHCRKPGAAASGNPGPRW